jgi:hypothetical protein
VARVFRVTGMVGTIGDDKPPPAAVLICQGLERLGDFRQEFQSVSERVIGIKPLKTGQRLVIDHRHPGVEQPPAPFWKVVDEQARVRLPGGPEVLLDTQMDSNEIGLEPAPAPDGEIAGLFDPGNPENPFVKGNRLHLAIPGHGQLDVMDSKDAHLAAVSRPYGAQVGLEASSD